MMALFGKGRVRTPKLLLSYCERRGVNGKVVLPVFKTAAMVVVLLFFTRRVPDPHRGCHHCRNSAGVYMVSVAGTHCSRGT